MDFDTLPVPPEMSLDPPTLGQVGPKLPAASNLLLRAAGLGCRRRRRSADECRGRIFGLMLRHCWFGLVRRE